MFPLNSNTPYVKDTGERARLGQIVGGSSTLPTASASTKGGVKIGSGLKMTGEVLSADQVPAHAIADAGKVLTVAEDGSLEWDTKGSGGGDAFLSYDFTKVGTFTVHGVEMSANGAEFNAATDYFKLIDADYKRSDITMYIDTGDLVIPSGTSAHQRFITGAQQSNSGLIWRYSENVWAIYDGSNWTASEITDPAFFDKCTFKIYIDASNYWHIYKNGTLVLESSAAIPISTYAIYLGSSSGQSLTTGIIKGIRIYSGNYTET